LAGCVSIGEYVAQCSCDIMIFITHKYNYHDKTQIKPDISVFNNITYTVVDSLLLVLYNLKIAYYELKHDAKTMFLINISCVCWNQNETCS